MRGCQGAAHEKEACASAVRGGRIEALEGDFSGWVTGLAVHWQPAQWHVTQPAHILADQVRADAWRARVGSTVYAMRNVDRPAINLFDVAV